MKSEPVIGIIGGAGKMGKWFADYFASQGVKVLVSDLNTELKTPDLITSSDIVIFSVPINKTEEVISDAIKYTRPDQMLMDLTSLKIPAVSAMLKSKCEVLGTHPMFGPQIPSLSGQTVILTKARPAAYTEFISEVLSKGGAIIKNSTPEAHDKMMALIQGLNHFNAIVLASCLSKSGISLEESMTYSSPIYKLRLGMVGRIMAQDPALYADIALLNPANMEMLSLLMNTSQELFDAVKNKDREGFIEYFENAAGYFDKFKEEAVRESNRLIAGMVEKEKGKG